MEEITDAEIRRMIAVNALIKERERQENAAAIAKENAAFYEMIPKVLVLAGALVGGGLYFGNGIATFCGFFIVATLLIVVCKDGARTD